MAAAPDEVEPRIGWRVWSVVDHDGALLLASLVYHALWLPGEEIHATCRRSLAALPWTRQPLHGPPNVDCCCGIYAVSTRAQAIPYLRYALDPSVPSVQRVLGRVLLWGRVVEGTLGLRAARGYPEHLYVPRCKRSLLARAPAPRVERVAAELSAYSVPVEVVDHHDS